MQTFLIINLYFCYFFFFFFTDIRNVILLKQRAIKKKKLSEKILIRLKTILSDKESTKNYYIVQANEQDAFETKLLVSIKYLLSYFIYIKLDSK